MTILEDLLINKETSNQLRDKMSLIFEYWATQINFGIIHVVYIYTLFFLYLKFKFFFNNNKKPN